MKTGRGRAGHGGVGGDARQVTEEFISRYGRGSAEPSERPAAPAQG
jgi:hypothetical protein